MQVHQHVAIYSAQGLQGHQRIEQPHPVPRLEADELSAPVLLVEGDEGADDRQRLAAGLWIHGDFICAEVRKGCQFMQT